MQIIAKLDYEIIDGAEHLKLSDVMRLLRMTYWADQRSEELVRRSMEHSHCYGIYLPQEEKLVGFARVISDLATNYYICDVVIDAEYRGRGLGTALISYIEDAPDYQGLRGLLVTKDAHALYSKFGFSVLNDRVMEKPVKR